MNQNHLFPYLVPLAVEVTCAWNVHQHDPFWNQLRFSKSHFHMFDQGPDLCLRGFSVPVSLMSSNVGVQLDRQLFCLRKKDGVTYQPFPQVSSLGLAVNSHGHRGPGPWVQGDLSFRLKGPIYKDQEGYGNQQVQALELTNEEIKIS